VGELVNETVRLSGSWPEIKLERSKNGAACVTCLVMRGLRPRGIGSNDTVDGAHSFKHLEREWSRDLLHEAQEHEYGIRNGRRSAANQSLGIGGDQEGGVSVPYSLGRDILVARELKVDRLKVTRVRAIICISDHSTLASPTHRR
jgi:hypothetical protein